jgi:hypothetical protein
MAFFRPSLISSGGGSVPEYAVLAWVCSPNTAGQSPTIDDVTVLTIDTLVQPASLPSWLTGPTSNRFSLAAGTYAFEIVVPIHSTTAGYASVILGLRKDPLGTPSWVSVFSSGNLYNSALSSMTTHSDRITIDTTTTFDITVITKGTTIIRSGVYNSAFTVSTSGADQRTTIKLWKLA